MTVKTEPRPPAAPPGSLDAPAGLTPMPLGPLPEQPLVSVLIANFNYGAYVGAAIQSALDQTYRNLEVIVCDDASTDGSAKVMRALAARDQRVTVLLQPANQGQAAATNRAFAASQGDIICLLDADDTFMPTKLERLVKDLRANPRAGMLLHRGLCVDRQDRAIQQIPYATQLEQGWLAERIVRRGGRWRDMPTSAISFRRELASVVFPIPEEDFVTGSDGFIFTLLPLLTEVAVIDDVLFHYRIHGANDTGNVVLTRDRLSKYLDLLRRQIEATNRRLAALGMTDRELGLGRNLQYRQQTLELALLCSGSRRHLLRDYLRLAPLLLRDDLYGPAQRLLGTGVYAAAILLPLPLRVRWLNATLGYTRFKERLRRLIGAKRGRGKDSR